MAEMMYLLKRESWEYGDALTTQRQLAAAVRQGEPPVLILTEHPPVFTIGISGVETEVTLPTPAIPVVRSDRGGRVTYHGPGQTMAYLIWDLRPAPRAVRQHVERLEQAVILALAQVGVTAGLSARGIGVWVGEEKIAALGVKVAAGVAYHGIAVNRDPDLTAFDRIVPCGIRDAGVTSLRRLGVMIDRSAWEEHLAHAVATVFDVNFT